MNTVVFSMLLLAVLPGQADFKAGVGRKVITPDGPIWMSGYAARDKPSESVVHDLWAKALALEDAQGRRVVIVTADLIALPREVCDEVAARLAKKHCLLRRQLVLNASHNHSGPLVWPNLKIMFDGNDSDRRRLIAYRNRLVDDLTEVAEAALFDLSPATLELGHGSAPFAENRRAPPAYVLQWPVDHDVPVLKVAASDGRLRAVLFGYACHNTTLDQGTYQINGDYAGFAQIELEQALPGTTALFLALCGGDQNPNPRPGLKFAAQHGKTLAEEVRHVLAGTLKPVSPTIRTAYEEVKLDFARRERSVFEEESKSKDRFRRRRAQAMLAAMDAGEDVWRLSLPVQAVALGDNLVLLALGGEVVVEYSLRLKREFPRLDLIVAGYSNDVPCYIPSLRVLQEGGYEPDVSMIYYCRPGPFVENVEETVIGACRRLLSQIGMQLSP